MNLSEEELEVWKIIQNSLENIFSGKTEEYLNYIHDNFTGWGNEEFLPVEKSSILSELKSLTFSRENISFKILPLTIKVEDSVAIARYVYSAKVKNSINKIVEKEVKLTDVLIKQNGKWFLLGDYVDRKIVE